MAAALVVGGALWLATFYLLPPLSGMNDVLPRLVFAEKCSCIAVLFCLVMGVEAVAHERLSSPAFDPLVGYETRRLRVNLRYLQNTLEQLAVFLPGLFGLAIYCDSGTAMRAVPATTVVWVVARIAFWVGYHHSAGDRGIGGPGMMLGMLVLLYDCARFGFEIAGVAGIATIIVLFIAGEALLFWKTAPRDH
ncbi:MAG: MAPEG family protein [Stellaceae bacterium]